MAKPDMIERFPSSRLPVYCPACGAGPQAHAEETDKMFEYVTYQCGGQLFTNDKGRVEVNNHCRNTLDHMLEKIKAKQLDGLNG